MNHVNYMPIQSAVIAPYVVEMPPSGGCITAERHTGGGGVTDGAGSAQGGNPSLDLAIKALWKSFLPDSVPQYRHTR